MLKFKYLIFIFSIATFSSCSLLDSDKPVPFFLDLKDPTVRTPDNTGFDTHKITDVWVFADGQILGVFPLPAKVPVSVNNSDSEITILADAGEFDYFLDAPVYEKDLLFWKEEKDSAITKRRIEKVIEILSTIGDDTFTADTVKTALWDYATEEGRGQVLWPMRVALSGKEKSPDPFILSGMLGKTETVARLRTAEQKLV